MENLTAILITFLRPGYTRACIESLRLQYPKIKIIVAENGKYSRSMQSFCRKNNASYIMMPYDSGVCVARNELVRNVDTDYVLVGDDDFFYTETAMVDRMLTFLENNNNEYDLIGGRVSVDGEVKNYQGFIEKRHNHFQSHCLDVDSAIYKYDDFSGLRYCPVDLTFNFFVARTEKVKETLWDEKIKVAYEHYSWFYDFKCAGGRVAFSPDPVVIHKSKHVDPKESPEYRHYRNRKEDKNRFFDKYNLDYTISMSGTKTYATSQKIYELSQKNHYLKYIDFCITTFKRPKALERLLFSIAKYYPHANVYIADQNETLDRRFYKKLRIDIEKAGLKKRIAISSLPYDCGLSYARNYLVTTAPNKYKLILDDDMVFTEKTDIEKFYKLLENNTDCSIVGGLVQQNGVDLHFEFSLMVKDETIYQVPDNQPMRDYNGISYKKTGCVLNFALFRRDLFNFIKWDSSLKVSEHTDFYLRLSKYRNVRILYTPDVVIDHPPIEREGDYKELRQRPEFLINMLRKHKVKRIKYLNGQVIEDCNGMTKRYKESPEKF